MESIIVQKFGELMTKLEKLLSIPLSLTEISTKIISYRQVKE